MRDSAVANFSEATAFAVAFLFHTLESHFVFRTVEENIEFAKIAHVGKSWCECIVDMMEDAGMVERPTPEQVWTYSASGELSYFYCLIEQAKTYWSAGAAGVEIRARLRERVVPANAQAKARAVINEFNSGHGSSRGDVLFIAMLKEKGLRVVDVAAVIETLDTVCNHCFDASGSCQCWNDE